MWNILLLILGFVPLILGANLLVDNASSLAKRLNIPNMVIGLTIVAFGTSAPEMTVNLIASLHKSTDLALGNVVGSNIFNILFILGVSDMVYPLALKRDTTWKEIPLCFLSAIALFAMANDRLIEGAAGSLLGRIDGFILLLFFLIFLAYNFHLVQSEKFTEEIPVKDKRPVFAVALVLSGIVLLVIGGRLIVNSAVKLADLIGMSERVIALTVVSVGTSLPELATSVVAARKKNTDIAIGNIVGSNIFNVFLILGVSAFIHPIGVHPQSNLDISVNIGASLLLFIFIFTGKGRRIERWEGILFVLSYLLYIGFLLKK
jgi:cation:H+ antiporter